MPVARNLHSLFQTSSQSTLHILKLKNISSYQTPGRPFTDMDVSRQVLSTLSNAVQSAPFPYLQEAAKLALESRDSPVIQGRKWPKHQYQHLSNDACHLVFDILCVFGDQQGGGEDIASELSCAFEESLETLRRVYDFLVKQGMSYLIERIISYKSDTRKIREYREKLKMTLGHFKLHLKASIQATLMHMTEQEDAIYTELREPEAQMECSDQISLCSTYTAPSLLPSHSTSPPNSASPSIHPSLFDAFFNTYVTNGDFTNIDGDQTNSTVTNNNNSKHSNNITVIEIANSNNNSSIKGLGRRARGK